MVLFVGAQVPARSLRELVELSKKEPLFYATPGHLSIHHLTFGLLASRTGLRMQHAPYKGIAQIATDVASGQVAAALSGLGSIAGFLKEGRIRALAWSGASRFAALPDVPTFAEAGVPDFVVGIQGGLFAHKATPRELIERLARDLGEAARAPEVAEFVARAGALAVGSTPEEFARAAQKDIERFSEVARAAGS
jgi:tripartite-type tricarboxylate transporter receptor subunit TctC